MKPEANVPADERIEVRILIWPVVTVQFPVKYGKEALEQYFFELEELMRRGLRGIIIDARQGPPPDPFQRKQLALFIKSHWQEMTKLGGVAYIVDSMLARGALTALSWVVTKPCPTVVVADRAAAIAWLQSQKVMGASSSALA